MKNNNFSKKIIAVISALSASVIFLITFVDSEYIPTWKEIFGLYDTYDKEADAVTFLDVGQGECALIQSNGRFALIDTGDGDYTDIKKQLKNMGVSGIDALILSHWHSDHCGGAYNLIKSFKIANAVFPNYESEDTDVRKNSEQITDICKAKNIPIHYAQQGMVINIGEAELTVLYCDGDISKENNRSLVIMVKCKDKKFLFTGDAEKETETSVLNSDIDTDCDVLKVPHHGSKTSSSEDFLKNCTPEYTVISVGSDNTYGHPSREVLNRLYAFDCQIYRTDYDGNITFNIIDDDITVSSQY